MIKEKEPSSDVLIFLNRYLIPIYIITLILNVSFYSLLRIDMLEFSFVGSQSGNDAGYYHLYAIGERDRAVNFWHTTLRFLHVNGLYDRAIIVSISYFTYIFVIPLFITLTICNLLKMKASIQIFIFTSLYFLLYPTVFYLSLDLYREIPMLLVFSIVIFFYSVLESRVHTRTSYSLNLLFFLVFVGILMHFRLYLGLPILLCFFLSRLSFIQFDKISFLVWFILGTLVAVELGLLDRAIHYRGVDGFKVGASSLGIGLIDRSPFEFLFLFFKSLGAQFLGLYFISARAVVVFFIESMPMIMMFWWLLRRCSFDDKRLRFFIYFIALYTTLFCISNDNLGTAMRLRIFPYISVFIVYVVFFLEQKGIEKMGVCNFRICK